MAIARQIQFQNFRNFLTLIFAWGESAPCRGYNGQFSSIHKHHFSGFSNIACQVLTFSSNFQCVASHIDFDYYFQRLLIIRRGLIAWGAQNVAARRGTCPWNFNCDVICCSHGKYSKFFARIRRLQYMSLSLVLIVEKKNATIFFLRLRCVNKQSIFPSSRQINCQLE